MRTSPDLGTPHLKHFSRRLKFWTPHCEAQARASEGVGLSVAPSKLGSRDPPRELHHAPGKGGLRVRGGRGLWGSGYHSQACDSPLYVVSNLFSVLPSHLRNQQLPHSLQLLPPPKYQLLGLSPNVPLVDYASQNFLLCSGTSSISIPKSQKSLSCHISLRSKARY